MGPISVLGQRKHTQRNVCETLFSFYGLFDLIREGNKIKPWIKR